MPAVLGISCHYHDAAAALVVDGRSFAIEEERLTRRKGDSSYPRQAIRACLRAAGIGPAELDLVVFYETPGLKLSRIIQSGVRGLPSTRGAMSRGIRDSFRTRLWIETTIVRDLGVRPRKVQFLEHHQAHAASSFLASPFISATTLTIDGVGEWATATFGSGGENKSGVSSLEIEEAARFPHSVGLFYSAFTSYLGFDVNEGEYKVMGLASYGQPVYLDRLRRLCQVEGGEIVTDMKHLQWDRSDRRMYSPSLEEHLGVPPRLRNEPFDPTKGLSDRDRVHADLAASIQAWTEDAVVSLATEAHRRRPSPRLAYAGGVALNGRANTEILRRTPFREVYVPSNPGDGGGALGSALYGFHVLLGCPRTAPLVTSDLGLAYGPEEIDLALAQWGLSGRRLDDSDIPAHVAGALARGKVVAYMQGRFEFGPRALGNRSILASPQSPAMRDRINATVKFREPFRPFAVAVTKERADDYLEARWQTSSAFMSFVVPVRQSRINELAAGTHFGTSRAQVVPAADSPQFHAVLTEVEAHTGTPAVINTSFNLRGEPIVATPHDALSTFLRSEIDELVMENYVIDRS